LLNSDSRWGAGLKAAIRVGRITWADLQRGAAPVAATPRPRAQWGGHEKRPVKGISP